MRCDRIELPGGGVAILCSRNSRRRTCRVPGCDWPAVALCDFQLEPPARRRTCDLAICARHRVSQPGRGSDGSASRDYCPAHEAVIAALAAPPP